MSQEINLINPALLPKQDLFVFRYVGPAAGVALLLRICLFGVARY